MNYNRRKFIRAASAVTAGALILPQYACNSNGEQTETGTQAADSTAANTLAAAAALPAFGIQLYTLRDIIGDDPKGILKQLADFGYTQIESYEGKQGMFWGMSHTDFKSYLDGLGLSCVSSHCDTSKDFEKKAAQAAEIGMKYLISPWVGPQKSMDDWKKIADNFNRLGAICQKNGIRFAYHNHDYSFNALNGTIPQDYIMDNTDPNLVDYEMDIYWVVAASADPAAYFKKYPNRWRLVHVKDRLKDAPLTEKEASCDLGTGSIDFSKILKVAKESGTEYFIVEQERYDNSTPLQSAKVDADFLKNIRLS